MLQALADSAPPSARWTEPAGGFFVLLELARGFDAAEILSEAIESGVAFVPGGPFFVDGSGANTLRLAFSKESPEKLADGVTRLCALLQRQRIAGAV
jgi:DNA-binding transcriptional MocR family regulator